MCFDWSALMAAKHYPKYQYVEGIALDPETHDARLLHAWLSDGKHAFDATWSARDNDGVYHPVPSIYIGIAMPFLLVRDFMKATGYQGVLANRKRSKKHFNLIMREVAKNASNQS